MGSVSRSRQSSSSEPWKAQQPYLQDLYSRAQTYSQGDPSSRIAQRGIPDYLASRAGYAYGLSSPQVGQPGFLEMERPGFQNVGLEKNPFIDILANRATGGITNPTIQALIDRGRGDPTSPYFEQLNRFQNTETNPYLRDLYKQGAEDITDTFRRDVLPGVHAGFGSAGRTGSEAHRGAVGQATDSLTGQLSDLAERLYGSAYEGDRTRALQAAQSGGQLYNEQRQQGLNALLGAGGLFNEETGQLLGAASSGGGLFGDQEGRKIDAFRASTERQNALAQQGIGAFDASTRRQGNLAQQALQRAQFGNQAARDRLGILTGLADRDRGYRQEFLNAPFNQLAQYSNLIGNPVLTSRSSGSSKGMGIG